MNQHHDVDALPNHVHEAVSVYAFKALITGIVSHLQCTPYFSHYNYHRSTQALC